MSGFCGRGNDSSGYNITAGSVVIGQGASHSSGADDVRQCHLASSLRRFEVFYCLHVSGQAVLAQRHNISVPSTRTSGVPRNFFRRGEGSTNSVEDRENGDLGAVAP